MKERLIIATYGGSGSTFLTNEIEKSKKYKVAHTHACPNTRDSVLGIPVFNRLTNGSEGPFSKSQFITADSKIVIVIRKPSEAYDSRLSFKHFCHLWHESTYFKDIVSSNDNLSFEDYREIFNERLKEYKADNKDILNLKGWLSSWNDFAENTAHPVYLIKYEDFYLNRLELSSFLNLNLDMEGFEKRVRRVKPATEDSFKELDYEYTRVKSGILNKNKSNIFYAKKAKSRKVKSQFHFSGMKAGVGDAINRFALAYSCVKGIFDSEVSISPYTNYHCNELDFLKLYGIDDFVSVQEVDKTKRLTIREFCYYCLYSHEYFNKKGITFEIDLSEQFSKDLLVRVCQEFDIKNNFHQLLNFRTERSSSDYFSHDSFKIVAHFRRNDIVGKIFKPDIDWGPIGLEGLHSRPLVSWSDVDEIIEELKIFDQKIELILVSDGLSQRVVKLGAKMNLSEQIQQLIFDLNSGSPKDKSVNVKARYIGNSEECTIHALNAMYYSDLVISGSSVFPNLICKLGDTKLIKVER